MWVSSERQTKAATLEQHPNTASLPSMRVSDSIGRLKNTETN